MATYNSNIIAGGANVNSAGSSSGQAVAGYPQGPHWVLGSVTIASNTTLATTDTLPLFYVGGPSNHIGNFWFDFPAVDGGTTLALALLDSNTTATTIFTGKTTARAGGWLDETDAAHATIGAAVSYTASSLIYLKPSTAATNTSGATAVIIYFGFEIVED